MRHRACRRVLGLATAGLLIVACGGESSGPSGSGGPGSPSLPLAEDPRTGTENTGLSSDLAPSQVDASTVAPPDTPPPCAPDDLELWTAQVLVGDVSADAVIRLRNRGAQWCEADVGASPSIDPAMEPDVWLETGGWADLVVGQSEERCTERSASDEVFVESVAIVVNGTLLDVPTIVVAPCGWRLTAFYPNDVATTTCARDDLDTTVVEGLVLVRNAGFEACTLGELVGVEAPGAEIGQGDPDGSPEIVDLAAGDVVAFSAPFASDTDCLASPQTVRIEFAVAGAVIVDASGCATRYALGAGRPYFGDVDGLLARPNGGTSDVAAVLAALDPFRPTG